MSTSIRRSMTSWHSSRGRLLDDQIAVVVDRKSGLARFGHHRRVPVDFAGVRAADDGDEERVRIIGKVAEAAKDADRHIARVALIEIDRTLMESRACASGSTALMNCASGEVFGCCGWNRSALCC